LNCAGGALRIYRTTSTMHHALPLSTEGGGNAHQTHWEIEFGRVWSDLAVPVNTAEIAPCPALLT